MYHFVFLHSQLKWKNDCMTKAVRQVQETSRPGGVDRALGGTNPWGMDW